MYQAFYNLSELPFSNTPDPRFFFVSNHHDEALSFLTYGIDGKKGFIVVTGEVGTGKTTLCRLLLDRFSERSGLDAPRVRTSLILNSFLSTVELLQAINADFGLPAQSTSRKKLIDELNRFLLAEAEAGGNAVVIIDESQNLSRETLEQVRMLSNLETEKEKLIQIVMVGQPEFSQTLARPDLRQLNQRIALRTHMTGLARAETAGYLRHRLEAAGAREGPFFTTQAEDRVFEFSRGIPRLINRIADQAIAIACRDKSFTVTHEMVEAAVLELDWMSEKPDRHEKRPEASHALRGRFSQPAIVGGGLLGLGIAVAAAVLTLGSAPSPDPSPAPSKAAETPRGSGGVWIPDGNGYYHARSAEEAPVAVVLSLLRLWGVEIINIDFLPRISGADDGLTAIGRSFGFAVSPVDIRPPRLLRLDRPFVVFLGTENGGKRPALVPSASETHVVLLDPLAGEAVVSWDELSKRTHGKGLLWWKGVEGIPVPFKVRSGSSLMRLQEILAAAGDTRANPDGRWGRRTEEAVRRAEARLRLPVTGKVSDDLLILLAPRDRGPSLSPARSGGTP